MLSGLEALEFVAQLDEAVIVVAAIVGAAGLMSTLAAVKAAKNFIISK